MEQLTLEELRKMITIDGNGRKVLDLINKNLSKVPSALSELTELEVLDLDGNKLKEVTGINKLKNLKQLYLSENKLNEFPESVCELEKLEELFVMSNNLKVLPNSVCKLKRLRVLDLSYNKLSSLPNDFAELEKLQVLWMSNNILRVLPDSVCKMKELRLLYLSNNNLSSLPDGFAELKLTRLLVDGNPFTVEEKRKVEEILNRIKHRIDEAVPQYISARGEQATAAYQRALKFGKTKDKRVKIYVIGKDRAGKTSLVRSLKGEPFRQNEVSTNGVEMSQPLMNADKQPWKNGALPQDTTVYHHRFAECINRDLASQEESVKGSAADYAGITVKQGIPTNEELEELGKAIGGNWKRLGRRLDVEENLEEIDHHAHWELGEKGYQMLRHWKQKQGSSATYQALYSALTNKLVERQDLAEKICCICDPSKKRRLQDESSESQEEESIKRQKTD